MEATPRPWEVDADFDYDLCFTEGGEPMSGWQIYGPKSWPVAAVWVEGIVDRHTGRANAEFIVKAANSHDRLIEALEKIAGDEWHSCRLERACRLTSEHDPDCAIGIARAALAAARGEGE